MPNRSDIIFNQIIERQLQLFRVDASVRSEILVELKKLEKEIISKLIDEETFTQKRLKVLLAEVSQLITDTYSVINNTMTDNMVELGIIESKAMNKTFSTVAVDAALIPIEKIKKLVEKTLIAGAPSEEWWKRQDQKLTKAFEDQVRTGVLLGENNQKLIQRVRGTKDFNYTNGIMNAARNDAEALVRSSVQTAANQSRLAVMEEVNHLIEEYKQVSTLDSRTSDTCMVRDGKRWNAQTKEPIGHGLPFQMPPLHWGCRSTMIAILKGISIEGAKRASIDGPIDADTTFETFLKGKPKSFVEDVLGKGKAELYLDGKINLRQLLDQSGNPLTLKQLKEKYTVSNPIIKTDVREFDSIYKIKGSDTSVRLNKLKDSEISSLSEYQSGMVDSKIGGYTTIQNYLRKGETKNWGVEYPKEVLQDYVSNIDSAIKNSFLDSDTTLYRGMRDGRFLFGEKLEKFCDISQGNLPMATGLPIAKFRGRRM